MPKFIYGIRFKTVVTMLILTFIPTVMIAGWIYKRSVTMLKQEIQYNQRMGIENMAGFMDGLLDDVDVIASNILTDKELLQLVTLPVNQQLPYQNYKSSTEIKAKIDRLRNVNENIDSIYLYDEINNRVFSTNFYGYLNISNQFGDANAEYIRQLAETGNQWNIVENGFWGSNKTLLSNRKHQQKRMERQFTFFINLEQKKINSLLGELSASPSTWYYVIDGEGNQIAYTTEIDESLQNAVNAELLGQGDAFEMDFGGMNYYVVTRNLKNTDWTFISLVPSDIVFQKLNQIRNSMIVVYVVTVILIFLFGIYMNKLIYVPIEQLIATMILNKEGTLSICDLDGQKGEFGEIARNFNELIIAQDMLNRKLCQQEVLTKNAEIRFLQSQINPHFLYNVLDTVHWMARMGRDEDVAEMTFALSRFYRSSLSEGKELLSVVEAIKLGEDYFDIEKIRFHNRIEMIVEIEESLTQILVPKRLFQPIIENAINHGMAQLERKGILMVSGIDLGNDVKFVIEDNGCGLEEAQVKRINQEIADGDFEVPGNYALKNLNSQLKMIYGEEYGLKLESMLDRGTTVVILLSKHVIEKEEELNVSFVGGGQ